MNQHLGGDSSEEQLRAFGATEETIRDVRHARLWTDFVLTYEGPNAYWDHDLCKRYFERGYPDAVRQWTAWLTIHAAWRLTQ